jgi:hypothetical protein
VFRVQELGIDVLGRSEILADDEDLGRDVTGRRRFGGFDLGEQLVEDPHQRVVVATSEDFCHERSSLLQELGGQLEGLQRQLALGESVLDPCGTDVGSSVVEDEIRLEMLEVALQRGPTRLSSNIADESVNTGDGSDCIEINSDDEGLLRAVLLSDLEPTSGCGTQIDDDSRFGQEVVLSIQMNQFAKQVGGDGLVNRRSMNSRHQPTRLELTRMNEHGTPDSWPSGSTCPDAHVRSSCCVYP